MGIFPKFNLFFLFEPFPKLKFSFQKIILITTLLFGRIIVTNIPLLNNIDTYPLTTQRQPYGDLVKPGTDLKKDDKLVSLFALIIERKETCWKIKVGYILCICIFVLYLLDLLYLYLF